MAFKSEAQRKKFAEMVKDGKITQATYDAWHSETGDTKLPERVKKEKPGKLNLAYKVKYAKVIK